MQQNIRVVYDEDKVGSRVHAIADQIAAQKYHDLVLIMMLRGGVMFGVDLSRSLWHRQVSIEIDFICITCNDDNGVRHTPEFKLAPSIDVAGRDVLLVDDSLGSGETFVVARDYLHQKGAAAVDLAVVINCLSDKWKKAVEPDYSLFILDDDAFYRFGYGEDVYGKLREAPFIGEYLDPSGFHKGWKS